MPNAIVLRLFFEAADLRRLARRSRDAAQARRLLALAAIYHGGTRTEAALLGDATLQIVRDWVLRCQSAPKKGSDSISMHSPSARLGRSKEACPKQVKASATIHLALDQL